MLKLKETLIQARDGNMDENALRSWLAKVQDEFVTRMTKLSEDIAADGDDESGEDEGGYNEDQQDEEDETTGDISGESDLNDGCSRGNI